MKHKLLVLLLAAFALRVILAPFVYHGDVIDFLNWGKNLESKGILGFYERDTPEAGPPNYPPLFYYILLTNQKLYGAVKRALWYFNVKVQIFPSGLYLWFESDSGRIFFNKLIPILSDLGIGFLIFKFINETGGKKAAYFSSGFYLFSVPSWYLSSVWGQMESLFAFPLVASLYAFYKGKYKLSLLFFSLSLMIKPTAILVLPVFVYFGLKRQKLKKCLLF